MAMQFFRNKRNSIFTIVIFGFIILTFIFWGTTGDMGTSTTELTRVNGEGVSYSEFQRVLNRQLEAYGQLFGQGRKLNKSLEDFARRQVASMLIGRKLLAQQARKSGIIVGKDDILKELDQVEAFQDPQLKRFSPSIYRLVLEQNGLRPREFEESLKEEIAAKRYQQLLEQSILTSNREIEARVRVEETQFDLKSAQFSLNSTKLPKDFQIKETELKDFYSAHSFEFLTPEKRVLEVARLDTIQFAGQIQLTDEELRERYEKNLKASDNTSLNEERARALHLLISDRGPQGEKRIQQIRADLRKEKLKEDSLEFENFFREQVKLKSEDYATSFRGGDLGYFSQEDMVKPFSEAVFKAKKRQLIGPVKTDFGYHLIYVLDKTSKDKSFENRKNEIAYQLRQERLNELLKNIRTDLEQKYVGKKNEDKNWLEQKGFSITQTSPIDRSARDALIPFAVTQKAFDGELKTWQEVEQFEDSLYLVRSLENIPPQPMDFETAKAQVESKLRQEKLQNLVLSLHQKLLGKEIKWEELANYGAKLKTEKSVKPFDTEEVPGFPNSDPLMREFHSLAKSKPLSSPILVEDFWVILAAQNFEESSLEKEALENARKEIQTAKSSDVLNTTIEHLMKEASIPESFRKEFGI